MPQHDATPAQLSGAARAAAVSFLGRSDTHVDVLVIGGGITGAGVALDAATRGLSTALVEAGDWASGTSSRSSKLVHGGIRYLEQMNFHLVREALRERTLLLRRIAPHLVHPIRFVAPLSTPVLERAYVGAGMLLYDLMARIGAQPPGVPWHRHLSSTRLRHESPSLRSTKVRGGIAYSDAQVDDARFVATLVRTAAHHGAVVANYTRVEGFMWEGGRVTGVRGTDLRTGNELCITAKRVICATGVWSTGMQELLGVEHTVNVRASLGVHIVVPRSAISSADGLLLRTRVSVLFLIPWGEYWIIGTTDTDWHGDLAHPMAGESDIDYLLMNINRVLSTPLTREDVISVYAGLRPLVAENAQLTSKISREHHVSHPAPGVTLVAGGKLTTYRVMAADSVDAALAESPVVEPGSRTGASVTHLTPLLGASGVQAAWNRRVQYEREFGLSSAHITRLLRQYGALIEEVAALMRADPQLAKPLRSEPRVLRAEIVYAATHEGAQTLEDVLERRTRLTLIRSDQASGVAQEAAEILGPVLNWDQVKQQEEVRIFATTREPVRRSAGGG